ncbi:MAG: START domain-containing protein [bacterium]|nr:START domain protein [Deltaproteobacteria bacterium]MCP4905469.1 START domain-containing protein [bacterium]
MKLMFEIGRVAPRPAIRILLSALAIGVLASNPGFATAEWTLDKQENGIDVYTRAVAGSGVKAFKGTAEFEGDVDAVLRVLGDSDGFKNWFPNTPESKLLSREGSVSYQYSVMAAPWPVSDRDNVLRTVMERDEETGIVDIQMTAAPDYYPEQANRVRVRMANGSWKLEPLGGGKIQVTFTMHLEPGGGIPKWLINARVVATPFEALSNLRASLGN